MTDRTGCPDTLFVDRATAVFAQQNARCGLRCISEKKAQQACAAALGVIEKKRVVARS
jgi:hypothetical protein